MRRSEDFKHQSLRRKKKFIESDAYLSSFIEDKDLISHKERGERGKYQRKSVSAGYKDDAIKILNEFANQKSLKFSQFGKIWKDGHYSLLYMGKENERELCETAYEMFTTTLNFITNPNHDFSIKVGAVYLLYLLYKKQPFPKYKVKIRMLYEDWQAIKLILDVAKSTGIYNCIYIILELIYNNAFHIVGCRFLMGPESSDSRNYFEKAEPVILNDTWSTRFAEFWDEGFYQRQKALQDDIDKCQIELGITDVFPDFRNTMESLLKIGELAINGDESVFDLLDKKQKVKPVLDTSIGLRRCKLKQQQLYAKCDSPLSRRRKVKYVNIADEDIYDDVDNPGGTEHIFHDINVENEKKIDEIESDYELNGINALSDREKHLFELGVLTEKSAKQPSKGTSSQLKKISKKSNPAKVKNKSDTVASASQSKVLKGKSKQTSKKKANKNKFATEKSKMIPTTTMLQAKTIHESERTDFKKSPERKSSKNSKQLTHSVRKTSWRKARIIGRTRPEKKIMKGKRIKYYDDSEEEEV